MIKYLELHAVAVSDAEREEAMALQQAAKEDPQVIAQAEAMAERYWEGKVTALAEKQGITATEAQARLPRRSLSDYEKTAVPLDPNHLVWIKGQQLTVEELVARGPEFDGCSMPDPVEGLSYGKSNAIFYWNDGNPCIHSCAHGLSTTYLLDGFSVVDPLDTPTPTQIQLTQSIQQATRATGTVALSQALDVNGFLHLKGSGGNLKPKATVENVRHLLYQYGVTVRYDVIAKELQVNIPGVSGTVDNRLSSSVTRIESLAALNGLSTSPIPRYLSLIADENPYNPIADWIRSRPWDGVDRVGQLCATLTVSDDFPEAFKNTLIRRWLLSAVAAALKPSGFHNRGVLTLQGVQGLGKTTWILSLVDDPQLREMYVLAGHHLDPSNKDTVLIAISHWIVELGELDSSFKKDIARIKSVITNKADKVRKPYAAAQSEFQRRTVFAASVNEERFLIDPTGNSRFWTLPLTAIDYQHGIDMQQLFAQIAVQYEQGEQWWLTREEEEMLRSQNRWHEAVNVIEETLLQSLDPDLDESEWPRLTASEVLRKLDWARPTNAQARECGGVLRKHFGPPKKINGIQKWAVPLRQDQFTRFGGA